MFDYKALDTTSRTTIAQLAAALLQFEPQCEVVISSAGLPQVDDASVCHSPRVMRTVNLPGFVVYLMTSPHILSR